MISSTPLSTSSRHFGARTLDRAVDGFDAPQGCSVAVHATAAKRCRLLPASNTLLNYDIPESTTTRLVQSNSSEGPSDPPLEVDSTTTSKPGAPRSKCRESYNTAQRRPAGHGWLSLVVTAMTSQECGAPCFLLLGLHYAESRSQAIVNRAPNQQSRG